MTIKNPHAPASEAQLKLVRKLAMRLPDDARDRAYERMAERFMSMSVASQWIEKLGELPVPEPTGDLKLVVDHLRKQRDDGKANDFGASLLDQFEKFGTLSEKQRSAILKRVKPQGNATPNPLIPAGRYAVQIDGEWQLFRVWRGTRNLAIQHVYAVKGTEEGTRLNAPNERLVATLVAKDPGLAARQFGYRTGHCGRCGKELEVNLSRKLGVGPECMKHVHTDEQRYSLMAWGRQELRDVGIDPEAKHDDLAVTA